MFFVSGKLNLNASNQNEQSKLQQLLEMNQEIQYLLYKKRFTIPGAKRYLIDTKDLPKDISHKEILEELKAIRALLD